ncbi:BamA/TamA family outer membrane protein [Cyclonatronum proteinivorum]|nr:BamA/TamA family outer membrane protein [Cyclonatronum proteinivorum]
MQRMRSVSFILLAILFVCFSPVVVKSPAHAQVQAQQGPLAADTPPDSLQSSNAVLSDPFLENASDEDEAYRNSLVPVPAIAYTPETSLMLGIVAFRQFKPAAAGPETRASQFFGTGIYTLNRQLILEAGTTFILPGERWIHDVYGGYNFFPAQYFPPGFDAPEADERTVEYRRLFFRGDFVRNIGNGWFTGPAVNFERLQSVRVTETDEGEPQPLWSRGNPENNTVAGLGWALRKDTRNSIMTPLQGHYLELTAVLHPAIAGSKGFGSLYLDARRYWKPAALPGTLVAAQFSGMFTAGDVPFQAMPPFGGESINRGYYLGRFNDHNVAQLQLELRQPIWWRFGAVAFASTGEVWNRFTDFSLSNPKYAGGAGFRFDLNPRDSLNVRIDYGFGPHGSGLYITLGEAF